MKNLSLLLLLLGVTIAVSAQNWFTVTELAPKTWVIDDHGADNMYLVEGNKKALLIDTGLGTADLVATIKKITDKPVIVVNTHGHPDHSGANYQFDKIYMHKADIEAAKMYSSEEQRKNAGAAMQGGQKPDVSELYKGEFKNPEYIAVTEGFEFDLGGRVIRVMETPGHTPGSICLLDVQNKMLFSGDTNNGLVWLFLQNCLPLSEYRKTLEKQVSRLAEFTTLYPGHGPAMESSFIKDQLECVKSILNGSCESQPYESFAGNARICSFGKASVAFNPENL